MKTNSDKGKLKIYLGMSAGVGKTYAMLKDAESELRKGIDVVSGYIEPHGRIETEALVNSFEILEIKKINYQNIELNEFNLEAALKRKPKIILVDELAHTNPQGFTHEKRWLDVLTLLESGINVYTTLNIQHLESIADLVSSITGINISETVPDTILKQADTIEVIDIPPEELIDRLKAGKIYKNDKIESALNNFFKLGNLLALREILLRKAAEKIDTDVLKYRELNATKSSWGTSNRMIVAIGHNKFAKKLIQKSSRIASSRKSSLTVVYVQTPELGTLTTDSQRYLNDALQLAQSLGANIEKCIGSDIVAEIINAAKKFNASLIVVGKPIKKRWKELIFGTVADSLIKKSGNIDVLLINGEADSSITRSIIIQRSRSKYISIISSLLIVSFATIFNYSINDYIEDSTIAMLYILSVFFIALTFGRLESIIGSITAILAYNYFFIEPKYTFGVDNPEYLSSFVVMLLVSMTISNLMNRIKLQNQFVETRERRALSLYQAGNEINKCKNIDKIFELTHSFVLNISNLDCCMFQYLNHKLEVKLPSKCEFEKIPEEIGVAKYVLENKKSAGSLTEYLPAAKALYLPIKSEKNIYGICGIKFLNIIPERDLIPTLEIILQQAAVCTERLLLEEENLKSNLKANLESMRNTVLSSVSHDFKTPLTVIKSASEQILSEQNVSNNSKELSNLILEHSKKLTKMVNNTLSLIKLENEDFKLKLEWESIEEIIGQALDKYRLSLGNRKINLSYQDELPLIKIDAVLIDQLISNIIENSIIHSENSKELNIVASYTDHELTIVFSDDGSIIKENKYDDTHSHSGIGLGLKLCELIAKLHGGSFIFRNRIYCGTEAIIKLTTQTREN